MNRIKIVFVAEELRLGGAEKALLDLVSLMDRARFDITVFAQKDTGAWNARFLEAGVDVVFDYSCRKATWNPAVKASNVLKKLRTALAYRRNGQGLLDLCCPGADIVVSYCVNRNERMAFAKGAATVKYIHGDVATNTYYRDIDLSAPETLARFDRIVCVSQAAYDSFRGWSGLENGVRMLHNPLNGEAVLRLAREPVAFPEDAPVICAVGRLSAEKGFERLIYIHKRLLDQGIVHKVVLIGDGIDRGFVERLIDMTQTGDSVLLTGYLENPYPYMKRCRFLVNTSYTEGLPVIAMEALCLGTPIVAPIPSVAEAFGGEMCGLITENNVPALEAGIREMLTDEALYARAKAGAERRSKYFQGRGMVEQVEALFEDLARERRSSAGTGGVQ